MTKEGKETKREGTKVPKNVVFLGLTSFLNDTSSEMIKPIIPSYLRVILGVSPTLGGLIMGLVESLSSLTRVIFGRASDRAGRRKVFAIAGYSMSTVSRALLALTSSWIWFLGVRIMDSLGKGVRTAPRDALIAESGGKTGRSFGFHRMMDTMGAVVGPVIGLLLLRHLGKNPTITTYHTIFLISVIPASLAVAVIALTVREVGGERGGDRDGNGLSREAKTFLLIAGIAALGRYSYAFTLWKVQALGYSLIVGTFLYTLLNVVYASLAYPFGLYSDRIGKRPLIAVGFGVGAITALLFAVSWNLATLLIAFVAYGVFMALDDTIPRAYMTDVSPSRGTAVGAYHTVRGTLLFPASLICGVIWSSVSLPAAFVYAAAMNVIAMLTFLFLMR
ncbi:MAG: MFS transporter [Thermococci archaeon]|nr:MFS transporter [Thermococci archaeon]